MVFFNEKKIWTIDFESQNFAIFEDSTERQT